MDLGVQNPWRIYAVSHHWLQSPSAVRDVTPPRASWSHSAARPPSPKWKLALISTLIKNKTYFTQDLGNPGIHFTTMQTTRSRILGIYVLRTRPWLISTTLIQHQCHDQPILLPFLSPSLPLIPHPLPFPTLSPHPPHPRNILGLLQLSSGYSPSQFQALLCITPSLPNIRARKLTKTAKDSTSSSKTQKFPL